MKLKYTIDQFLNQTLIILRIMVKISENHLIMKMMCLIICEYKTSSPSMGDISNSNIEDVLKVFEQSGAAAISVLTEEKYFKGSMDNLRSACKLTKLPIIRKDFIIHEYQIYQAKLAGANACTINKWNISRFRRGNFTHAENLESNL